MFTKFILYACPVGELADQIEAYFEAAKTRFSWNPALDYMPHCSLTGFFRDHAHTAAIYMQALGETLARERSTLPHPVMQVTGTFFEDDFHGLALKSDWLTHFAVIFAAIACSATRPDAIRLKEWLHLSLAYQFKPEENEGLKELARQMIDPCATVGWELRFYQRHRDKIWTCHGRWPLSKMTRHFSADFSFETHIRSVV